MNPELEAIKAKVMAKYNNKQSDLESLEKEIIECYKLITLGKDNIPPVKWYGEIGLQYLGCNYDPIICSTTGGPLPILLKICEDNEEKLRKLHHILMEEVRKL